MGLTFTALRQAEGLTIFSRNEEVMSNDRLCSCSRKRRTLVRDLEDGPEHFVLLFAFMAGVFGVFELVLEFEEGI